MKKLLMLSACIIALFLMQCEEPEDAETPCFSMDYQLDVTEEIYTFMPNFEGEEELTFDMYLLELDDSGNSDTLVSKRIDEQTPAEQRNISFDLSDYQWKGKKFEFLIVNTFASESCINSGDDQISFTFETPEIPCPTLALSVTEDMGIYTLLADFDGEDTVAYTLYLYELNESNEVENELAKIAIDKNATTRQLVYDLTGDEWKGKSFRVCVENTFANEVCRADDSDTICTEFKVEEDVLANCTPLSFNVSDNGAGVYTCTATFEGTEAQTFSYKWILFEDLLHNNHAENNNFNIAFNRVQEEEEIAGTQDHTFTVNLEPGRAYRFMLLRNDGNVPAECDGSQFYSVQSEQIIIPLAASCEELDIKITEVEGVYTFEPIVPQGKKLSYRFVGDLVDAARIGYDTQWDYVVTPSDETTPSNSFDLSGFPAGTILRVCVRNQFSTDDCVTMEKDFVCKEIVVE